MSQNLSSLDNALRRGAFLHVFRSGGGLRVARLTAAARVPGRGDLVGYGEHYNLEEALVYAGEDYDAGQRAYGEVYGEGKLHDHYLTGSCEASSPADAWVLGGHTIDAWYEQAEGVFVVAARGTVETPFPLAEAQPVMDGTLSARLVQNDRDEVFALRPSYFPNGYRGCSMTRIGAPEGTPNDHGFRKVDHRRYGDTFEEALATTFAVGPKVEVTWKVLELDD